MLKHSIKNRDSQASRVAPDPPRLPVDTRNATRGMKLPGIVRC
jgi:hypothetical protein